MSRYDKYNRSNSNNCCITTDRVISVRKYVFFTAVDNVFLAEYYLGGYASGIAMKMQMLHIAVMKDTETVISGNEMNIRYVQVYSGYLDKPNKNCKNIRISGN